MENSKKGLLPFRYGIFFSKKQCPKTDEEKENMIKIPYAKVIENLMYVILCTRPNICYVVGIVSRYQSNPGPAHWTSIKHILKYLIRTKDYMLVYFGADLNLVGYMDSNF